MRTDITKLIVDFHNFANAPKKRRNMNEGVAYKEKLRCVKNSYDYRSKYFFFFF